MISFSTEGNVVICEWRDENKVAVRNCDSPTRLGDTINGRAIIKIEAYGRSLDVLGEGMTALITLG